MMDDSVDTLSYCISQIYEGVWGGLGNSRSSGPEFIRDNLASRAPDDVTRNSIYYLNNLKERASVNYDRLYYSIDKVILWMTVLGATTKTDIIIAKTALCLCRKLVENSNISSKLSSVKNEMENLHELFRTKNTQIMKMSAEKLESEEENGKLRGIIKIYEEGSLQTTSPRKEISVSTDKFNPPASAEYIPVNTRIAYNRDSYRGSTLTFQPKESYNSSSPFHSPSRPRYARKISPPSDNSPYFGKYVKDISLDNVHYVVGKKVIHYGHLSCKTGVIMKISEKTVSVRFGDEMTIFDIKTKLIVAE